MATELELRKRIRSVKNISTVTAALSAVSASKARRAEKSVRATRDYAGKAFEILNNLAAQEGGNAHIMLATRDEIKRTAIVLISGDRGLCGGYNTNVVKITERFIAAADTDVDVIAIGRKGRDLMVRRGYNVTGSFIGMPTQPGINDILPVARIITDDYLAGKVDQVFIAYTDFINLAKSEAVIRQLLPLRPLDLKGMAVSEYVKDIDIKEAQGLKYTYEPAPEQLLDTIVPRFIELQIYQSLLEAIASEESARFVAMNNATDNANSLVDALTLERNKVRQTNITNEILDIVGGAEALAQ